MAVTYNVGFAVSSAANGTLSNVQFDNTTVMTNVPQRSANMLVWLRSDVGVTSSGGNVSAWADQSGNGNNATQSSGTNKPTLVTGAISASPALAFNGTNEYMALPSGFAKFPSGASIFAVYKPTAGTAGARIIDFGPANTTDSFNLSIASTTTDTYTVYNGSTATSLTNTAGMTLNQFQLLEMVQTQGGLATMWTNSTQNGQAALQSISNVNRTGNFIGQASSGSNYFTGQIAEIFVFNAGLNATDRVNLENYVASKYGIGSPPAVPPTITPASGVYPGTQSVSMTQPIGSQVRYTLDGSVPTITSPLYTAPFLVTTTTTVNAMAFYTSGPSPSAMVTSVITIDPSSGPVSNGGVPPMCWFRADSLVTKSGSAVTQWGDLSGNGFTAVQATGVHQPTFVSNIANGQPAISFTPGGSGQYLAMSANAGTFNGLTAFIVQNTGAGLPSAGTMVSFGAGVSNQLINITAQSTTQLDYQLSTPSGGSQLFASNSVIPSQFQVNEVLQNTSSSAFVWLNSVLTASQNPFNPSIPNANRTVNYIGQQSNGGQYFLGSIAEIIVLNTALTSSQRTAVEAYLSNRYQTPTQYAIPAPVMSSSTATLTAPTQLVISAQGNATIYVTVDGTTPTTSSPVYTKPLNIDFTQTVKAIAVVGGSQSAVTSNTYTLDSTQWPPANTDATGLKVNVQVPSMAIP